MKSQSGNTMLVVIIILAALVGGGLFLNARVTNNTPDTNPDSSLTTNDPSQPTQTEQASAPATDNGQYIPFSQEAFDQNQGKRRVLFFHANWCPTCKAANNDIVKNADDIPKDVVIFKTDYDSESELKKKYDITYQHTFVLVDENGEEIKKWNGGNMTQILQNIN